MQLVLKILTMNTLSRMYEQSAVINRQCNAIVFDKK